MKETNFAIKIIANASTTGRAIDHVNHGK